MAHDIRKIKIDIERDPITIRRSFQEQSVICTQSVGQKSPTSAY